MAIIPAMLVYCDADESECPLQGMQAFPDHHTRTIGEAWEKAKAEGWRKRNGGKHYCPDCVARVAPIKDTSDASISRQ